METEQETKTLRQIVADAFHGTVNYANVFDAIVHDLKEAGYARQPQTSPVGELSEEDHRRLVNDSYKEHNCDLELIVYTAVKKGFEYASRQTASTVYVTAERPPTAGDADSSGEVLANCPEADKRWERKGWRMVQLNPGIWKTWKPLEDAPPAPIPPVSVEEAAWNAHCAEGCVASRASWDAAIAFCNREGASK